MWGGAGKSNNKYFIDLFIDVGACQTASDLANLLFMIYYYYYYYWDHSVIILLNWRHGLDLGPFKNVCVLNNLTGPVRKVGSTYGWV